MMAFSGIFWSVNYMKKEWFTGSCPHISDQKQPLELFDKKSCS